MIDMLGPYFHDIQFHRPDPDSFLVHALHPELAAERTDFGGVTMTPKNTLTYLPFLLRYGWFQSRRFRNKILSKIGFHPKTHLQEAWDYLPVYRTLFSQLHDSDRLEWKNMAISRLVQPKPWDEMIRTLQKHEKTGLGSYENCFKLMTLETFYHHADSLFDKINAKLK